MRILVKLHLLVRVHLWKASHVLEAGQVRFEEMTLAGDEGLGGGGSEPVCWQEVVACPPFKAHHTSAHRFHLLRAHPLSEQQGNYMHTIDKGVTSGEADNFGGIALAGPAQIC